MHFRSLWSLLAVHLQSLWNLGSKYSSGLTPRSYEWLLTALNWTCFCIHFSYKNSAQTPRKTPPLVDDVTAVIALSDTRSVFTEPLTWRGLHNPIVPPLLGADDIENSPIYCCVMVYVYRAVAWHCVDQMYYHICSWRRKCLQRGTEWPRSEGWREDQIINLQDNCEHQWEMRKGFWGCE
jgi:hypothetical protein